MGLSPNRHTWSFLNLAPEAPQWCRVHHWVWVKISGDQASRQHSPEAPQLLSKHRHRRCRALLTLPALNVKLCGNHVKLHWHVVVTDQSNPWFWFVIFYRTIFLEMYTHHPANSFSSLSKVCWGDSWLKVFAVQWIVPINRSWIQFNSFQLIECNWIEFKSMNSLFSIYCVPTLKKYQLIILVVCHKGYICWGDS